MIERAYEQIKLDFGYQQLGVNLISVGSAFDYSQLGCSHHCYADISLISHFKNSNIFFPASPMEFNRLFKSVYQNRQINYFRLPETAHGVVFEPDQIFVGKAVQVAKGEHVTIVVMGPPLKKAIEAASLLNKRGVTVDLLYYPTLKPFDEQSVAASAAKTHKVLVIEEASAHGGIFSSVLQACKHIPSVRYSQMAIEDFIHEYGTYEELCDALGFSAGGIVKKIDQELLA
jgi:transketolase